MAASMKFSVFWDAVPRSHVEVGRSFRGAYCLHHQGDDYGGSTHLWNVELLQRDNTALHSRRLLNFITGTLCLDRNLNSDLSNTKQVCQLLRYVFLRAHSTKNLCTSSFHLWFSLVSHILSLHSLTLSSVLDSFSSVLHNPSFWCYPKSNWSQLNRAKSMITQIPNRQLHTNSKFKTCCWY
jgi:hypothetical protein